MESNESKNITNPRRQFLGTLASGVAATGLFSILSPLAAQAENGFFTGSNSDPDEWFKQIKGKHRVVFDVPHANEIFPFAWPRIFLATNAATGTPEKDCSVVVVLRHFAIGYALEDRLWAKYKLGEFLKLDDPKTGKPATRNPFWKPKQGDFNVPGVGVVPIGINELQESGVMFAACNMAIIVYSAVIAKALNLDPEEVKKDWLSGVLPGVQVMPAGIWAIDRAQEKGCSYVFAG